MSLSTFMESVLFIRVNPSNPRHPRSIAFSKIQIFSAFFWQKIIWLTHYPVYQRYGLKCRSRVFSAHPVAQKNSCTAGYNDDCQQQQSGNVDHRFGSLNVGRLKTDIVDVKA